MKQKKKILMLLFFVCWGPIVFGQWQHERHIVSLDFSANDSIQYLGLDYGFRLFKPLVLGVGGQYGLDGEWDGYGMLNFSYFPGRTFSKARYSYDYGPGIKAGFSLDFKAGAGHVWITPQLLLRGRWWMVGLGGSYFTPDEKWLGTIRLSYIIGK